jgi:hypothetical protein
MRSRQSLERPIFWQRGISRSQASLCYAKIAPATPRRGDFAGRCCAHAEAAGQMPKSELRDLVGVIARPAAPIVQACRMARS